MRAVVFTAFGGPEVLAVSDVEAPNAGPGQVRVRVHAAAVNPFDWKLRAGALPMPIDFPYVPGLEAAGVVDQVGPGVDGVSAGDEVFGLGQHTIAEHAVLTAFARKPASMSWEQAASLPVAAETAVRTLGLMGLAAGQTIIIGSAAGSVGTIAVQLAVRAGATVIGTAGEANHDYLRGLGATPVSYGAGLVERARAVAPQGIDLAFDYGGHGALPDLIELTGSPGKVITIADPTAAEHGVRFSGGGPEQRTDAIATIAELFDEGAVILRTGSSLAMDKIAEAHRISQDGHAPGKPLIEIA